VIQSFEGVLLVVSSITLPLLVAGSVDLADHLFNWDVGWTVGEGLPLKSAAIEVGNED
jgi:hypothetical protein